jgi:hypothetical protein
MMIVIRKSKKKDLVNEIKMIDNTKCGSNIKIENRNRGERGYKPPP